MNNIQDTKKAFQQHFSQAPELTTRAPGRVNLIGEHTDYNDGFVLPCAIHFATEVSIAARDDDEIVVIACDFDDEKDSFSCKTRPEKSDKTWANYVRGMVAVFMEKLGTFPHGFNMTIAGDVPQGTGLSSSAALEIAVGKALQALYLFDVDERAIALLGQQAENDFVGCRCGIMDQFISALGQKNAALLIDCRDLHTEIVPMPTSLQLVVINSNVKRGLVDSEYNDRRAQCEAAAAHFGVKALRDVTLSQLEAAENELDPVIFRRARHVISENARTLAAVDALKHSDIEKLSELMAASHASMRDDFEITVPAIDALVEMVAGVIGKAGGVRMTGGGFGGCVVALLPKELLNDVFFVISQEYPKHNRCEAASIYICSAEDGAHVL